MGLDSQALEDLQKKSIFTEAGSESKWKGCPDLNTNVANLESDFAKFLNNVAEECARVMGIPHKPPMRWTAKYSTNILPGHEAHRKPDLALFTIDTHDDWRCIRSFGEMKSYRSVSTGFAALREQVSGTISLIIIRT
jgi:hypothetical protein